MGKSCGTALNTQSKERADGNNIFVSLHLQIGFKYRNNCEWSVARKLYCSVAERSQQGILKMDHIQNFYQNLCC